MQKLFLLLALSGSALLAQDVPNPDPGSSRTLWRASIAALTAANAMDIQSSWGKHELNPALANNSGTFGAQGALLKLGLQGSLVGIEYLITHHHSSGKLYRVLGIVNFGAAAGIAGVAVHNYGVPQPGR
ncbi:MAG: hypothetical protein P4L56_09510 [Candidatus Sulfopaludibacter sp.]|nr:hypothetical protein [Candidatus Sulfopaludibacter sp.]